MSLIPLAPFAREKFGSDLKLLTFAQSTKADPDIIAAD
jgi:hypothetical protein